MNETIQSIKFGLALVMLTLIFGLSLGIFFGIAEDSVKSYIAEGIATHPEVHDKKSNSKIWRYAQRAHFHATGIAAFSIGLVILTLFSSLSTSLKPKVSILIGLGGLYPLSWFSMFLLAPSLGRRAAHSHIVTEACTYIGVLGLFLGITILCANLFFDLLSDEKSLLDN